MKRLEIKKLAAGIVCTVLVSSSAFAGSVATMQKDETGVFWTPKSGVTSVSLRVVGPNEFFVQKECDTTDISITEFGDDGLYKYEMTSNPKLSDEELEQMRAEREAGSSTLKRKGTSKGLKQSGHFRVVEGQPMVDSQKEEK